MVIAAGPWAAAVGAGRYVLAPSGNNVDNS